MPSPKRWRRPLTLADLTPRRFLRIEGRLLRPAGPRRPREPNLSRETCERYDHTSDASARTVLAALLRSYQPGDPVGYRQVRDLTHYSTTHSHAIIHRLKALDEWPFTAPPFNRSGPPIGMIAKG